MKIWVYAACSLCVVAFAAACKPTEKTAKGDKNKKGSTALVVQMPKGFQVDSLRLFAWEGIQAKQVAAVAVTLGEKDSFKTASFTVNSPEGLYYVGANLEDVKPVVVGVDKKITLRLDTAQMARFGGATFIGAPNNTQYLTAIEKINAFSTEYADIANGIPPQKAGDTALIAKQKRDFADLDARRLKFHNELKANHPNLARINGLYMYLSYANNRKSEQETELDYFTRAFFQYADLKDSAYYRTPHFFETVKNFSSTIQQSGINSQQQQTILDTLLSKVPSTAPHYQPALLAVAFSYIGRDNRLFHRYGTTYAEKYTGKDESIDKFLEQQLPLALGPLAEGTLAPDFSEATPEGKNITLSQLRGKVVLIDFWASWCGPCRRENPNVVKVYAQYKDLGFEILGVSLDSDRQRWLDAIKADNLTWLHVSDLKGWQCAAAKLYGVSGIPFTVLLDKQGRIIGKNLRGPALEAKLKEVFGK